MPGVAGVNRRQNPASLMSTVSGPPVSWVDSATLKDELQEFETVLDTLSDSDLNTLKKFCEDNKSKKISIPKTRHCHPR